jgi:hypothetical protein
MFIVDRGGRLVTFSLIARGNNRLIVIVAFDYDPTTHEQRVLLGQYKTLRDAGAQTNFKCL